MGALRHPLRGQLGLLDAADRGRRCKVELDATSWVEHTPGWLDDAEGWRLMTELAEHAGWEQRERWMYDKSVTEPRLTAEYPVLAESPTSKLRDISDRLSALCGVPYDSAWLNWYRDHHDSTAWHGDRMSPRFDEHVVPVLSLGETRRFLLRPKPGGRSLTFVVKHGDLVVMGGRCQRDWVHCVPKETAPAGPRISINFGSSSRK